MSGNGLPSVYAGVPTMGFAKPYDIIPSAGGGGCVTEGPFKESATHHLNYIYKAYLLQYGC